MIVRLIFLHVQIFLFVQFLFKSFFDIPSDVVKRQFSFLTARLCCKLLRLGMVIKADGYVIFLVGDSSSIPLLTSHLVFQNVSLVFRPYNYAVNYNDWNRISNLTAIQYFWLALLFLYSVQWNSITIQNTSFSGCIHEKDTRQVQR